MLVAALDAWQQRDMACTLTSWDVLAGKRVGRVRNEQAGLAHGAVSDHDAPWVTSVRVEVAVLDRKGWLCEWTCVRTRLT